MPNKPLGHQEQDVIYQITSAARCPGVTEPNIPLAIDCDAMLGSLVIILTTLWWD